MRHTQTLYAQLTGVFSVKHLQLVIPINEKWTPETIIENITLLRSQIKWKNFKLTYDDLTYQKKGYFVIYLSYDEPERKSSFHIWRNKVEITSKNWVDIVPTIVMLSYILRENGKSIFLDSLFREFAETRKFNRQYQELCLEIVKSQYLDLIEGKVPKELLETTKEVVRMTFKSMLKVVEKIH
jgi:hypothetical protein